MVERAQWMENQNDRNVEKGGGTEELSSVGGYFLVSSGLQNYKKLTI